MIFVVSLSMNDRFLPSPSSVLSSSLCMCFQDEEGSEWKEMQLSPSADSVSLRDLSFRSGYEVKLTAINANGSSIPATFNFTIGEQPGMHPLPTLNMFILIQKYHLPQCFHLGNAKGN